MIKLISVIRALAFREYRSRYAGAAASYLWAYATPFMWIAVILATFYILGRRIPVFGSPLAFVLSGILPYMIFRLVVSSVIRARSAYARMIDVTETDTRLIACVVAGIELINLCFVFLLLSAGSWVLGVQISFVDPLKIAAGLLSSCAIGLGFVLLTIAMSPNSSALTRAIPIVLRPSFYLSAVFYIPEELPGWVASALSLNPLVHSVGLVREGMFSGYDTIAGSALYAFGFASVALLIAWPRLKQYDSDIDGDGRQTAAVEASLL